MLCLLSKHRTIPFFCTLEVSIETAFSDRTSKSILEGKVLQNYAWIRQPKDQLLYCQKRCIPIYPRRTNSPNPSNLILTCISRRLSNPKMDQLFGGLRIFIRPPSSIIDNHIYRLHYKFSVLILIACSIMVTARQYFGDPIDCISKDDIPANLLDTYCWIHTTFSVESGWFKKVGSEVPYPGVDKYSYNTMENGDNDEEDKRIYHAYYQWVCFVLFFQALLFYIPRYLWKSFEGGKIRNLILGLDNPIMDEKNKSANQKLLVEYLARNRGTHLVSFIIYSLTELLNFLNVIFQMYIMDRFLGGEFSDYGWKVLLFTEWDWSVRYDPMIRVFPRLTKCTFHRYGSSGDLQRHDAMCILPINIINEKIYVFLWFWFYFLAVASLVAVVYRVSTCLLPNLRILAITSRCRFVNQSALEHLLRQLDTGDWFLLNLLSKNMNPHNFRDLVIDYCQEIDRSKPIAWETSLQNFHWSSYNYIQYKYNLSNCYLIVEQLTSKILWICVFFKSSCNFSTTYSSTNISVFNSHSLDTKRLEVSLK